MSLKELHTCECINLNENTQETAKITLTLDVIYCQVPL